MPNIRPRAATFNLDQSDRLVANPVDQLPGPYMLLAMDLDALRTLAMKLTVDKNGNDATSSSFDILPRPATQLAFGTPPSNTPMGSAITPAVTVWLPVVSNVSLKVPVPLVLGRLAYQPNLAPLMHELSVVHCTQLNVVLLVLTVAGSLGSAGLTTVKVCACRFDEPRV